MTKLIDMTGNKIGRLTMISRLKNNRHGMTVWLCQCECGNTKAITANGLRRGGHKSCGCLRQELIAKYKTKHGHAPKNGKQSKEYGTWCDIIKRCTNLNYKQFKDYGGRGIKIDETFRHDFGAFLKEVGLAPSQKHQIDRVDNEKGYVPGNLRWVLPITQQRNKRTSRLITFNGETKCLAEWAELYGIKYSLLQGRLNNGFSMEMALTMPSQSMGK